MSVLIKGMDMPKAGTYICELGVLDEKTATLTIYTPINKPQKSYRIAPVPPHGRLIDADALKKNAYPFPCAIGTEWAVTLRYINDCPTIIEAEEG